MKATSFAGGPPTFFHKIAPQNCTAACGKTFGAWMMNAAHRPGLHHMPDGPTAWQPVGLEGNRLLTAIE
jgi:hypothetical protein